MKTIVDSMIEMILNKEMPSCARVVFRRLKKQMAEESNLYLEAKHMADDVRKHKIACRFRDDHRLDKYWTIVSTGYEGEKEYHDEKLTRTDRTIEDILREAGENIEREWRDKDR